MFKVVTDDNVRENIRSKPKLLKCTELSELVSSVHTGLHLVLHRRSF